MALYDLGDQVELTIYVTTDAGVAATATVTCTITLPDGTTATPTPTTSATGTYSIEYAPSQAGTHYVRWVADAIGGSAAEDDVFEDSFTVSISTNSYISLDEAKGFLNIASTDDDAELGEYLEYACDLAQQIAQTQFARKTVSAEKHTVNGSKTRLDLRFRPVLSVTTVTERGTTLTADTQYTTDLRWGSLYRMSGTYDRAFWSCGTNAVSVTYVAGYVIIPPPVRFATLQILEHLWQNQRAGNPLAGGFRQQNEYPGAGQVWNVPNKARDILLEYRPPGVA